MIRAEVLDGLQLISTEPQFIGVLDNVFSRALALGEAGPGRNGVGDWLFGARNGDTDIVKKDTAAQQSEFARLQPLNACLQFFWEEPHERFDHAHCVSRPPSRTHRIDVCLIPLFPQWPHMLHDRLQLCGEEFDIGSRQSELLEAKPKPREALVNRADLVVQRLVGEAGLVGSRRLLFRARLITCGAEQRVNLRGREFQGHGEKLDGGFSRSAAGDAAFEARNRAGVHLRFRCQFVSADAFGCAKLP